MATATRLNSKPAPAPAHAQTQAHRPPLSQQQQQQQQSQQDRPPQFHLFSRLPPELRREIYILATPPRVVDLIECRDLDAFDGHWDPYYHWEYEWREKRKEFRQEAGRAGDEEGPDDCDLLDDDPMWKSPYWDNCLSQAIFAQFLERLRTEPLQFQLHEDLVYFVHNWRATIEELKKVDLPYEQRSLDYYGFTSSRKLAKGKSSSSASNKGQQLSWKQPWKATPETPEITLTWLLEHPTIAYEMVRKCWFHSPTTIPPLLHTCRESRGFLISFGYELAFGTRSCPKPRTWFHFDRDRLYLKARHGEECCRKQEQLGHWGQDLLSGSRWEVGQLRPHDLRRIKRIVLADADWSMLYPDDEQLTPHAMDHKEQHKQKLIFDLVNLLCLLPSVEDLGLQEWGPHLMQEWLLQTDRLFDDASSDWTDDLLCLPVEEVDIVALEYWQTLHGKEFSDSMILMYNRVPKPDTIGAAGTFHEHFSRFKEEASGGKKYESLPKASQLSFFQHQIQQIPDMLREMHHQLNDNGWRSDRVSMPPINVPQTINFLHVCPGWVAARLLVGRYYFWLSYVAMQNILGAPLPQPKEQEQEQPPQGHCQGQPQQERDNHQHIQPEKIGPETQIDEAELTILTKKHHPFIKPPFRLNLTVSAALSKGVKLHSRLSAQELSDLCWQRPHHHHHWPGPLEYWSLGRIEFPEPSLRMLC